MANSWRKDKVVAEHISNLPDQSGRVSRIPVPGGWIIICSAMCADENGNGTSMAMTFVSDEGHRWLAQEGCND